MAVHQCPHCELRFRSDAEFNDHLVSEHAIRPRDVDPFRYGRAREDKPLYPDLVEEDHEHTYRVLVVANSTLRARRLQDRLTEQSTDAPTQFLLVVPAVEPGSMLTSDTAFMTVGRPAHPHEDALSGAALARHRMDEALKRLRGASLQIEGTVGDSDPLRAVADALKSFDADEIFVSTMPQQHSRWLAVDLPAELRRRFGIPVTVVSAG